MKLYRFFWKDGTTSEMSASEPAEAFTLLGYGQGALNALDYWTEVKPWKELEKNG